MQDDLVRSRYNRKANGFEEFRVPFSYCRSSRNHKYSSKLVDTGASHYGVRSNGALDSDIYSYSDYN